MSIRAALLVYRALLVAMYPASHLDRVGDDMVDCLEDLLTSASRRGGLAMLSVVVRTYFEVPRSALAAHRMNNRHRGRGGAVEALVHDIRFALRGLVKQPTFTALAVVSLGLGVGANTTMFSMVNGTLWAGLDVPDAEEMVRVSEVRESAAQVSFANFRDIAAEADVFQGAFLRRMESFGLVSDEISLVVHGEVVTPTFFDVLEIEPRRGRFFTEVEHGDATAPPVAVMSHHLWTGAFGSDPSVVGRTVELNETPVTVIGIAPESFQGTKFGLSLDLWLPMGAWATADGWTQGWQELRGARSADMLARLSDDVTLEGANAALEIIGARLAEEYPEHNANMTLRAAPQIAGEISPDEAQIPTMVGLLAILGSGLVLLIACGNVASLLLARAVSRRQEMGVRIALGAGRGRLVRQLLTESLVLAALGASVGLGIAEWLTRLTGRMLPNLPYRFGIDTSPDTTVVLFASAVSLAAVLVFGLTPALQASKSGIAGALRGDDSAAGMRVGGSRLLNGVVVSVVSLSFVTLFLAGLFASSLGHVRSLDPGFAKEGRVMATLDFGLAGMTATLGAQTHDQILDAVRAIPGVDNAALTGPIPMGDFSSSSRTYAEDHEYAPDDFGPTTWSTAATPDFLEVAGLTLLGGRWIEASDDSDAPPVVVINDALARTFWPDELAIGKRLRLSRDPSATAFEVVGVVGTGRYMSLVEQPRAAIYFSMEQGPRSVAILMATTTADPNTVISPLRDAVLSVDRALTPYDVKTMSEHMSNAYWLYRLGAEVGLGLGLLSALLAAGGLYGIMAFRVGRQRREMGIRIALGAGGSRVLRHVLSGSLRLVLLGVTIGAAVAVASSGVVQSIVFGVETGSVKRLASVGLGLTALALVATLAPALSATRADPVQAIKAE